MSAAAKVGPDRDSRRGTTPRSRSFAAVCGLCLLGAPGGVRAVEVPPPGEAMDYLSPVPLADVHPRWTVDHRRESLVVGDVLVWPSLTIGSVVDSNPFQLRHPGQTGLGLQIAPKLLAERDVGVHRTTLYATGDVRTYPAIPDADVQHGRAGLLHDWSLARDTTVRLQAEVIRRTDPFDNSRLVAAGLPERSIEQTDVFGAGSLQRTFSRSFVVLSGSVLRSRFDALGDRVAGRSTSSETVSTLQGRAGAMFGPGLFAFVEPAANTRTIVATPGSSSGTRVVAGLGAIGPGLVAGEVFAGRQVQFYQGATRRVATPVLGGRAGWTPRPGWTFAMQVDRTLGDVAVATVADRRGAPVRQDTATVTLHCLISPLWVADVALVAIRADYPGSRRRDRLSLAEIKASYALSRSLDLTGTVRFMALRSTIALASYQRAEATLGATYHY